MTSSPKSVTAGVENEDKLKYTEILKNNGITEPVSEVIIKDAGLVGQGFASKSLYITVKFENPELPQLNLFGKAITTNPSHVEVIGELKAFEKEARFFTEYIPAAKILCEEKGHLELMDIYPKCYYGDDTLIVMENLVLDKGFTLNGKENKHGLEEAKASILSLAKHHAISCAVIEKYGGGEGFLKAFKDFDYDPITSPGWKSMMEPMIANSVINNTKLLEKYNVKDGANTVEKIKCISTNVFQGVLKSLEINPKDNFLLLNHGDYHNNNMMFVKDPATQEVLHHIALDYQIVRYNSPGVDLGYFLFLSVKQEVRRQHREELLTLYFTNFKKVCEDLGHHIAYSYEDLFLELRKKFHEGFWFGFAMVGPGFALVKDASVSDFNALSDFTSLADKAMQKWIEENPKEGEEVAKEIVGIIEEYYELRLD